MTDDSQEVPTKAGESEPSLIATAVRDAVLVSLVTGAFYLFAYFHSRAFLAYFGVPDAFVEIDITAGIVAASAVILVTLPIFSILSAFSPKFLLNLVKLVMSNFMLIFFVLVAVSVFWTYGFTPTFFLFAFVSLFGVIYIIMSLIEAKPWVNGLEKWADLELDRELRFRRSRAAHAVLGKMSNQQVASLFFLAFAPLILGEVSGKYSASRKVERAIVEVSGSTYVLVDRYEDGFIMAEITKSSPEDGAYSLTGGIRWIGIVDFSTVTSKSEKLLLRAKPQINGQWTSWPEFWDGLAFK